MTDKVGMVLERAPQSLVRRWRIKQRFHERDAVLRRQRHDVVLAYSLQGSFLCATRHELGEAAPFDSSSAPKKDLTLGRDAQGHSLPPCFVRFAHCHSFAPPPLNSIVRQSGPQYQVARG